MIAAVVAIEIEHASQCDTMQFWQPDANNLRTWRPMTDGFEERSIGSYCVLFLLMSGDVSLNPGPTRHWKHPCTTCQKPVKSNQAGLQCDQCDAWTHLRCLPDAIRITKQEYNILSRKDENWYCYQCQLPTFSDSFFSTTSAESEITDDEPDQANAFDEIRNRRPTDLFLAYLNINSLRNKVIDLRDMLRTIPVDILGISETKLDHTFPNAQFNIDGYRLFRKDRNQHGGGLLAYMRADIPCRQIRTLETKSTESVTLELQLNKTKCVIVVAYKPPNVTNHAFTLDMTNLLDRATRDYSDIWIIGDLNFDLLDRIKSETLRDVCDVYGLDQLIKEPTNTTIHGSSLIDVILTTAPTKTSSSGSTNIGAATHIT